MSNKNVAAKLSQYLTHTMADAGLGRAEALEAMRADSPEVARNCECSDADVLAWIAGQSRRADLLVSLKSHDHGDGCLGIIIDEALRQDPDATEDDIRAICIEAEEDARREAGSDS